MTALIVIALTLTETIAHSKNLNTRLDHHHNPDIIELDPIQIPDLINIHQLIRLNPLIT